MEDFNQVFLGDALNALGIEQPLATKEQSATLAITLAKVDTDIQPVPLTSQSPNPSVFNTAIADPPLGISGSQSSVVAPLSANESLLATNNSVR